MPCAAPARPAAVENSMGGLPRRCRRGGRQRYPAGGLPGWSPAYPAFSLLSCPLSPHPPSPVGKGETQSLFRRGASPPAPLHLTACGTYRTCQASTRRGQGGWLLPLRHLVSLPRGRGPSQTPPSLATDSSISPGPPSPWLPALLIGKRFFRFCAGLEIPKAHPRRVPDWQGEPVPRRFSPGDARGEAPCIRKL